VRKLADDVYLLGGFPPNAINVYLVGEVLIDAATRQAQGRIERQLSDSNLTAHALTHVHPDHQGASHRICTDRDIPLWCGEHDVAAMEVAGSVTPPKAPAAVRRFQERFWVGPPHPVARALHDGDDVAGFTVLETPGHTAGHIAFWRQSDRVLIAGDVINTMNVFTGLPGLHEPPDIFTTDPATNRASIRKIAALEPALVCVGHGAPLRNPAKLAAFAARLAS
jgi:glyoxylase-like metal-dependent hydrolase (beta-lactamase superfamily II)